ncbi:autotransporter adhesin [Neisseria sp. HSC-16F19]|nr:YadA-like family protein [Neisseria sp. HSC-16F19]MCP2039951.1 autotransporter adhesin [Neisseria sp. HSC-16F19]
MMAGSQAWAVNGAQYQPGIDNACFFDTGTSNTVCGNAATSVDDTLAQSVAIGANAKATGLGSGAVAIGRTAHAAGQGSTAIGINARSEGQSIAIGTNANNTNGSPQPIGGSTIAIGNHTNASKDNSVAIGNTALATGTGAIAQGFKAKAEGQSSVVIGDGAENIRNGKADQVVAVGTYTRANSLGGVSIGSTTTVDGVYGTAIGIGSVNKTDFGVALGALSSTDTSIIVNRDGYDPLNPSKAADLAILATRANAAGVSVGGQVLNTQGSNPGQTAVRPDGVKDGDIIRRQIHNVAAGTVDTDAVNVAQLKAVQTHYYSVNDGGNAGGNYNNDGAKATNALAAGVNALATGTSAVAVGASATASNVSAVAVGLGSTAAGNQSLALGVNTKAETRQSVAIGYDAQATTANNTVAIGASSRASATHATAVGTFANASGGNSLALGQSAAAAGASSVAIGRVSNAYTGNDIAMGSEAKAGVAGAATSSNAIAIGLRSTAANTNALALGTNAKSEHTNAVALGSLSQTAGPVSTNDATVNGIYYSGFAGNTAHSTVSVGNNDVKRTITNVAAGRISDTSTDAINGSQLYMTQQALGNVGKTMVTILGGNAQIAPTGELRMTNIGDTGHDNIHDAIKSINDKVGNINNVDLDASAGVAQAIATAGLPQAYLPGKNMIAVSTGYYRGHTGYAVGFSTISDNGNWIIKATGSGNSRGKFGASIGAGYQW